MGGDSDLKGAKELEMMCLLRKQKGFQGFQQGIRSYNLIQNGALGAPSD